MRFIPSLLFLGLATAYKSPNGYSLLLGGDCKWNDFELEKILGKGGHGVVIKALHKPSGKHVALKILSSSKENERDLEREESIHASVNHKLVSQFYCGFNVSKSGQFGGRSFSVGDVVFAIELVNGKSLREIMKNEEKYHPKIIVRQLIDLLVYFRSHGIVFGDLSSGNVMLTSDRSLKLIDFGAALNVDERHQDPKPTFVSYKTRPHRWRNFAADWYSLGLLIEEMLVCLETGHWRDQRAFKGRACSSLVNDKRACDLVKHLVPLGKDWESIWGTTDKTIQLVKQQNWLA